MRKILILIILICVSLSFAAHAEDVILPDYPIYSPHEHKFEAWTVKKAPSENNEGIAIGLCAVCGTAEGRKITKSIELTLWQNAYLLCGEDRIMDCTPIIANDRTMLPVRYVAEGLGAAVEWDAKTSAVTVKNDTVNIKITIGKSDAYINGKKATLDSPAFIENDRTYMPVRFIAEALGATVSWNAQTQVITIADVAEPVSRILNIPYIYQKIDYPNGCESVSTVMVLRYFGMAIDPDTFMDKYLDCGDAPVTGGIGPDPDVVYCGDPHTESGWGCHSPVIVKALNKFASKNKLSVSHAYGKTLDELCKTYIDNDIPVIIWATVGMQNASANYYYSTWETVDGKQIRYNTRLHCLVLVGYDSENYYFNDPLVLGDGVNYVAYPKKDAKIAYNLLYRQSIAIKLK